MRSKLIGLSLLLVGCTHHVVIRFPNTLPVEQRQSHWVNGWLWNLVGGETDATNYCGGQPVARIDVKKSVGNSLVSWLTLGIYTPMHVTMQCAQLPQNMSQAGAPMYPQPQYVPQPAPQYAPPPVYAPPPR